MKTIADIQTEIDYYIKTAHDQRNTMSDHKRGTFEKEVHFLNMCKRYLETNPRPEFIKKQYDETVAKIEKIERDFMLWFSANGGNNSDLLKKQYYKRTNYACLLEYRTTLEFILEIRK